MGRPASPCIAAGLKRLRELGLDPATASAGDLEGAAASSRDVALAVISRLSQRAEEESAAALARIAQTVKSDKELRRNARRALYRLKQRGIVAPGRDPKPAEGRRKIWGDDGIEGYLSPFDPLGDRLFWILKSRPGGGLAHLSVIVNEPEGLRQTVLTSVTRKSMKKLRDDLARRNGIRLVACDWRYIDWIASEGYERAREAGSLRGMASPWPQLRMQVLSRPAEPRPSPILSVLSLDDTANAAALATSAELFEDRDFGFWHLPEAVLQPWLERYAEMRDSPLVLGERAQATRVEELVQDTLRTIFAGRGASAWQRRLEETAWILWNTERPDLARKAFAAAAAVGGSESGASGIPFFETLTRRSFSLFIQAEAEKEEEAREGSLIVTPDQIRQQQTRSRRGR